MLGKFDELFKALGHTIADDAGHIDQEWSEVKLTFLKSTNGFFSKSRATLLNSGEIIGVSEGDETTELLWQIEDAYDSLKPEWKAFEFVLNNEGDCKIELHYDDSLYDTFVEKD